MKIHNIRLGYATNSSSSHSIIYIPTLFNEGLLISDDFEPNEFGWDFFTLATPAAKNAYLATMLFENFTEESQFSPDLILLLLKGLGLDQYISSEDTLYSANYIDHQSRFSLPKKFGTDVISLEFFKEFSEFVLKDGVYILGGNDNDDKDHPLYDERYAVTFGDDDKYSPNCYHADYPGWVCRKDDDWWVLYNKMNGNRAVFSFKEHPAPFKPKTPMLIDFSITDYCNHGCAFCYKGSTIEGTHADSNKLDAFIGDLVDASVFEVAIGGGEPTQYPYFEYFVEKLKFNGIVANFTTKSTDWIEDEARCNRILAATGGFAFSANHINEISRILDIFRYRKMFDVISSKFTVQLIPAVLSEYTLKFILEFCSKNGIRVTLLGYKESGRGAHYREMQEKLKRRIPEFDEDKWIPVIRELSANKTLGRLAIDTTLAAKYDEQLKAESFPEYLYHVKEGQYSAYIDAVSNQFGPSSYHLDQLIPYGKSQYNEHNRIETLFSQITPV